MKETSKAQSPPYVRYLSWLTRPFPDFDFFFIKSARRRAAELLELKPGDRVIDAGCGSGGSFPFLVAEIGDAGEIVGIEISPESTASARRRTGKNGWRNVSLIVAPAHEAKLNETCDSWLIFLDLCNFEVHLFYSPAPIDSSSFSVFSVFRGRSLFGMRLSICVIRVIRGKFLVDET